MSLLDSVRVLGAMARITAPTLVDVARGSLERSAVDERARWFGRRVIELLDVKLEARGAENVPPRAVVYMSNHQSHLDIPMLYATLPSPTIRMLAKAELFRIPLWGRGLRGAEFIEVDRSNHARREVDRASGAAGARGGEHLPGAGGHALGGWPDRQAEEGRLPPGDRDRSADRACRDPRHHRHPAARRACDATRKARHRTDRTAYRRCGSRHGKPDGPSVRI